MVETAERLGIAARTAFIVTGDHGFSDIHTRLAPNVWLAEAGLRGAAADRGRWRATFHSGFLHLKDAADTEAVARVRTLLASRPPAERRLFRIVERDELDAIGADPSAPFALTTIPGVSMSDSPAGQAIATARGGTHGFFPDFAEIHTGFVGWAPVSARGRSRRSCGSKTSRRSPPHCWASASRHPMDCCWQACSRPAVPTDPADRRKGHSAPALP